MENNMKLLVEQVENCSTEIVLNEETKEKSYYITGPFMEAECVNRNRRMYPKSVMESALNVYSEKIRDHSAMGELNHPNHPMVNSERAVIKIVEMNFGDDGKTVMGKAKVLGDDFPCAKIVRGMIKEGIKFGVSSRALGSVVLKEGVSIVQPDFKLNAIDVVTDPSGPNCFVNGLMESADWIFDEKSGTYIIAEQIKTQAQKMTSKELEEKAFQLMENFLNQISKKR
jgi:hypothetical protein